MSAPEQRWVLVPARATPRMLGEGEGITDFILPDCFDNSPSGRQAELADAYHVMLSAAPKPSEGDLERLVNSLMFEMERRGWPTFGSAPPGLVRDAFRAALDALGGGNGSGS